MVVLKIALALVALVAGFVTVATADDSCKYETRDNWGARDPVRKVKMNRQPSVVIIREISRDGSDSMCTSKRKCVKEVKDIQSYYVHTKMDVDIPCNFLVGGDGYVYEGRSWWVDAGKGDNIVMCVMGKFDKKKVQDIQFNALKNILRCGVITGKLKTSFRVMASTNPGKYLYERIRRMPNFTKSV